MTSAAFGVREATLTMNMVKTKHYSAAYFKEVNYAACSSYMSVALQVAGNKMWKEI